MTDYPRIIARITKLILVIGATVAAILAVRVGWRFGLGFLLGAAMSYLSFWRWQHVVESLGGSFKGRSTALMVVRFVLLVAAAYGIINYLEVNPVAVFLGLLVAAAAVTVAIVFELFYGT